MKTEEDDKIINQVRKIITELEQSSQSRELLAKAHRLMEESLPLMQREFLRRLLAEPEMGGEVTQKELDELKLPLRRSSPIYMAVGRFDWFPANAAWAHAVRMFASLTLKAEELMSKNFILTKLMLGNDELILILQALEQAGEDNGEEDGTHLPLLSGALEALQDFSREALGLPSSFVFCSHCVIWEDIESSYSTIYSLLNASLGLGGELLLNERNFIGLQNNPVVHEGCESLITGKRLAMLKTMPSLLERGESNVFLQALGSLTEPLAKASGRNNSAAQELYCTIATMLLSHINRCNLADKLSQCLNLDLLTCPNAHAGWSRAASYLSSVASAVFELKKGVQKKNINESVDRLKQYINEHISEDLSLVKLAEISYFNPSYISRLFKQVTGQNIKDFVSGLRIEKAKSLLRDRGKRISEISNELGFESQHYFSRFFKKYTGLTPQEHRENIDETQINN